RLQANPTRHALRFGAASWTLDLAATPVKPATFHDEDGFLVGPEGWTYYYSWPRMQITGTLATATSTQTVTGAVWMDHQWGDFAVSGYPSGWQWFAIQFDDGTELMVTEARDRDGQTRTYGTFVRDDGQTIHLSDEQISLTVEGEWTSPHTDATYPAGWRLSVPSLDLKVDLLPIVADQEVTVAFPPQTIYWEGATSVVATRGGRPVGGNAFVELVGYVRFSGLPSPRR
ncbi:MAG: carotenoid 1,2-hydratase, partial [Chloroflexi bacterium]|nr:carotenoid 1,2-hydratase [Chloroflexota bacterium]